jgi:hypothetical protein
MSNLKILFNDRNIYVKSRFAFDVNYQAILNYAIAQGYTLPSSAQQLKQNTLLKDLKSNGIWQKLDTLAILATDGGSNFALIDWKKLTQYTSVNSPTFITNQGFQGNGTSSYLDTNFNPSTQGVNYTLNNASRYGYVFLSNVNSVIDGNGLFGRNRMVLSSSSLQTINSESSALNSNFEYSGTGMKSIHRTSSTDVTLFNNSVSGLRTVNSSLIANANQFVFRAGSSYSINKISMYAIGASLVSENTDFVNSFNTYINSL